MYKLIKVIISLSLFCAMNVAYADAPATKRIPQFSNDKVTVWETIIYPTAKQSLVMHRHDNDRVLVSFDDGMLKITNDKGVTHYLKLEKNKSYYLTKDVPGEKHMDENISKHPIKVLVIQLAESCGVPH